MDIFVVGFPRSGNVWVSRLLGDALDSTVAARNNKRSIGDEGLGRTGKYTIRQEHSAPFQFAEGDQVILVIRDPRDVIVSAMHYWVIADIRKASQCVLQGEWPTPQVGGWLWMYDQWKDADYAHLIRYEDLWHDPKEELQSLLESLGEECIPNINQVIARQCFDARRRKAQQFGHKMPFGKQVQMKALRKGIIGDWTNHFDEESLEYVAHHAGDLAKEFGYDVHNY